MPDPPITISLRRHGAGDRRLDGTRPASRGPSCRDPPPAGFAGRGEVVGDEHADDQEEGEADDQGELCVRGSRGRIPCDCPEAASERGACMGRVACGSGTPGAGRRGSPGTRCECWEQAVRPGPARAPMVSAFTRPSRGGQRGAWRSERSRVGLHLRVAGRDGRLGADILGSVLPRSRVRKTVLTRRSEEWKEMIPTSCRARATSPRGRPPHA